MSDDRSDTAYGRDGHPPMQDELVVNIGALRYNSLPLRSALLHDDDPGIAYFEQDRSLLCFHSYMSPDMALRARGEPFDEHICAQFGAAQYERLIPFGHVQDERLRFRSWGRVRATLVREWQIDTSKWDAWLLCLSGSTHAIMSSQESWARQMSGLLSFDTVDAIRLKVVLVPAKKNGLAQPPQVNTDTKSAKDATEPQAAAVPADPEPSLHISMLGSALKPIFSQDIPDLINCIKGNSTANAALGSILGVLADKFKVPESTAATSSPSFAVAQPTPLSLHPEDVIDPDAESASDGSQGQAKGAPEEPLETNVEQQSESTVAELSQSIDEEQDGVIVEERADGAQETQTQVQVQTPATAEEQAQASPREQPTGPNPGVAELTANLMSLVGTVVSSSSHTDQAPNILGMVDSLLSTLAPQGQANAQHASSAFSPVLTDPFRAPRSGWVSPPARSETSDGFVGVEPVE